MLFKVSDYRKLSSPITFTPRWLKSEVSSSSQCFCPDRGLAATPRGRQRYARERFLAKGRGMQLSPGFICPFPHVSSTHSSPGSVASCFCEMSADNPPLLIPQGVPTGGFISTRPCCPADLCVGRRGSREGREGDRELPSHGNLLDICLIPDVRDTRGMM